MSKSTDIPLAKVWCELWNERQHLIGTPAVEHLEIGIEISSLDLTYVFIRWMQYGTLYLVKQKFTRGDFQLHDRHDKSSSLTITTAVRTLTQTFLKKVEYVNGRV